MANNRMSWNDIVTAYPEQWVRLDDVEWEPDNDSSVVSAVVAHVGEPTIQDYREAMSGRSALRFTETGRALHTGIVAVQ